MSQEKDKTVQIYLPTGNPRGIRRAFVGSRSIQAIQVPRSKLSNAHAQEDIDRPGIYFIFERKSDEPGKPLAYIGKGEDCYNRLVNHRNDNDKKFWEISVSIFSRYKGDFTPNHLRYLEHKCIKSAEQGDRYELINSQTPSRPDIPDYTLSDIRENFKVMRTLLSVLGVPILDPIRSSEKGIRVYCRSRNADATGEYNEDGLVVFKGSTVDPDPTDSVKDVAMRRRRKLRDEDVIVEENGSLRFGEDYRFDNPTAAAGVVAVTSINGRTAWKDETGRSIKELEDT